EALDAVGNLALGGQHEDATIEAALANSLAKIHAVEAGQHHVQDQEIETSGCGAIQAGGSVGGGFDDVAFGAQQIPYDPHDAGFVLNEKDARAHVFSPVATGRRTMNVAPLPFALRSVTVPLCASTISLTRLNPRPAPRI